MRGTRGGGDVQRGELGELQHASRESAGRARFPPGLLHLFQPEKGSAVQGVRAPQINLMTAAEEEASKRIKFDSCFGSEHFDRRGGKKKTAKKMVDDPL